MVAHALQVCKRCASKRRWLEKLFTTSSQPANSETISPPPLDARRTCLSGITSCVHLPAERGRSGIAIADYPSLMASLFPLRGFSCPPRLSTAGAEIVVMLNRHNPRGSIGATPAHGPLGIQPTLDLNCGHPIVAGQTLGAGCLWWSKSCARKKAAL
jgi:hypothetical protein